MSLFKGVKFHPSKSFSPTSKYSVELLHKSECLACPLNHNSGAHTPHMEPTGSKSPVIYVLGEAPDAEEDEKGEQFVGKTGKLLRSKIPRKWRNKIRWNNCVRTRPPKNRKPTQVEVECCRPSVIRDIEASKPKAIFGFGDIPLHWVAKTNGIQVWSGRHMPVKVGNHICWFFPFYHPSYVLRSRRYTPSDPNAYGSEEEFAFNKHLRDAFDLLEDLPPAEVHTAEDAFDRIEVIDGSRGVDDYKRLRMVLRRMSKAKIVGLDYETNGLRPYTKDAKILTVGLSDKKSSVAFALEHPQAGWSSSMLKKVKALFYEFLVDPVPKKVVHNLAFDLEWSAVVFGTDVVRKGKWGCSQSQAYIIDERVGSGVSSLDGLCFQYFGLHLKALSPVDRAALEHSNLKRVLEYNAVDAKYHRLLYIEQSRVIKDEKLYPVYSHNLRRILSLVLTQIKGIPVDFDRVDELDASYSDKLNDLDRKIEKSSSVKKYERRFGKRFRPSSNSDVLKLVTEILGHSVKSVSEDVLSTIDDEVCSLVLQRRKVAKLLSTYVHPVKRGSDLFFGGKDLHPIFSTCITRTWRTSSDSPNVQNWPKRDGTEIRTQVSPGPGKKIVSFDYSGIQARNVCMESKDPALIQAFREHYDIHFDWMERIADLYPQWVEGGVKALSDKATMKQYRHYAKNKFVFPKFFGAQSKSVAASLGIPIEIVDELSEEFWDRFPKIKDWHQSLETFYRKNGYVTGLSGFRRHAPVSPNEIINTPIQSDESIIVCDALMRLSELEDWRLQPILEVHDDLTFIFDADEVDKLSEIVITMMLDVPFEWARIVPMGVEMSIGDNWGDMETVGEWFSDTWNGSING